MTHSSKGHIGCHFKQVHHPLQHHSDTCPAEESSNGETRRPSRMNLIPSRQLVRALSSAGTEDERKVLCESLSSSASNSQHSLTGPPCSAFPAPPPPQASPVVLRQPNRVRATAHFHPCFHPCFLLCFLPFSSAYYLFIL